MNCFYNVKGRCFHCGSLRHLNKCVKCIKYKTVKDMSKETRKEYTCFGTANNE